MGNDQQAGAIETRQQHLIAVLRSIRNVNRLIITEENPERFVERVCTTLAEGMGYFNVWICLLSGEAGRALRLVDQGAIAACASAGFGDDFGALRARLESGAFPACMQRALETGNTVVRAHPATDCPDCPLSGAYHDRAGLTQRLAHGGMVFGILTASVPAGYAQDSEEQDLFRELANDLAFALHRLASARRLQDSEARFRAAFDSASIGRALTLPDGRLNRVNGALCEMLGYSAAELEEKIFAAITHPDDVDESRECVRSLLAGEQESCRFEKRFLHRNGTVVWTDVSTTLLRDDCGNPLNFITDIVEITDQKRAEEALLAANQQLRAVEQQLRAYNQQLRASNLQLRESEERFRQVYEHMAVGIARVSLDMRIEQANEAYCQMLGYTEEQLVGMHLRDITRPEVIEENLLRQAELVAGEIDHFRMEKAFIHKDRHVIHGILDACLVRTDQGKPAYCIGSVIDITERKLAQREVTQRERLLSTITTNMFDMVSLADMEVRCTYASPSFRQIGHEPHELVGRLLYEFVHEDDLDGVLRLLEDAPHTTEDRRATYRWQRGDGSYAWLESIGKVLTDTRGERTGLIFSSRDVTEQRKLQSQIAQSDRLSSMGMLAAGVAHEINNPLSYVLYNLESLTEDLPKLIRTVRDLQQQFEAPDTGKPSIRSAELAQALNPAMLEDILARFKDALGGTHRIRDIARGLGSFSRVEKDQTVPVNLMHVIEVALNMAYNEIKYRARLVKDYGRIPTVLASEGRLSQVFLNLIINATHAIDEGDVENNEIRVKTWVEDERVCAEVRDTGSGIAPENVEKLFEPFFTTKKLGMGSGLGLPISKNIVESYGGSISVQSELGEGTAFVVRLPIRVEEADTAAEEAAKTDEDSSIRGRILIVDDEAAIRSVMARMLREHETVQAASGAEAKKLLQHDQNFDLILCDMMMPDLSGMDLHRWLLETSPALAKQLIFITGGAFTPRAREYLSTVDNIRLEKPFDVANFIKIVNDRLIIAKGANLS